MLGQLILIQQVHFNLSMDSPYNLKQIRTYGMVLESTKTSQLDQAHKILKEAFQIQGQASQLNVAYFIDGNWKKVFSIAISLEYIKMYLNWNNHEKIIMDISQPDFLKLQILHLDRNKISSIEQLQFLNIPKLEEINLNSNQITQVNALNKCAWNSLSWLALSGNPINQIGIQKMNTVMRVDEQFSQNNESLVWIYSNRENSSILAKLKFNHFLCEDSPQRNHSFLFEKWLNRKGLLRYLSEVDE